MIGWSVELSKFDISYEPRGAIKSQCLADFATELPKNSGTSPKWVLYVEDSSNKTACGARVVLEGPEDLLIEQALQFSFKATNNQAEYEAILAGLNLANDLGAREVTCKSDSQLVVGQIKGEFEVKEPLLQRYYHTVSNVIAKFDKVVVEHIPRQENERDDALSRLASSKKQSHHRSVVQMRLPQPSVGDTECMAIIETHTWMTPITQYLEHGTCQPGEERSIRRQCARYTMIGQDLYRRGYSTPLLKCLTKEQSQYVLQEIHDGACGSHSKARTTAAKVIRAGYYWPTVHGDSADYVKKCQKCQEFGPLHHRKPEELHSMTSPWPFAMWGMDIIGPFSPGKGQTKHLLVTVDYFTKWIEAEPLATITARNVQNFVWKNIVCQFDIPHSIVSDNGRQFIDQGLMTFYNDLGIKSLTSSVEHPQTNGQAEAANKVLLNELRKRLGTAKGRWTKELPEVLWAYRCTPQSTT